MYRKAFNRPKASERPRAYDRNGRLRIPRNDGRSQFFEAIFLLSAIAVMAVTLGLVVGIPLAMMLHNICASLKC